MWIADTSVWIEHFRNGGSKLAGLLSEGRVLMHPCVAGELTCGNLKNRAHVFADLDALPYARVATDREVLFVIEDRTLWGRGLGWIDVHLLASALLTGCGVWTLDKRLERAGSDLGLRH
jgi:predicted nucleic acid-binding protein